MIYVQGYWDLLHVGYVDILQQVKASVEDQEWWYLLVGVLPSQIGVYECVQTVEERWLTLLSLTMVDDVIFDVNNEINEDFCCWLGIDKVFEVKNHIDFPWNSTEDLSPSTAKPGTPILVKSPSETNIGTTQVSTINSAELLSKNMYEAIDFWSKTSPDKSEKSPESDTTWDAPETNNNNTTTDEQSKYEKELNINLSKIMQRCDKLATTLNYYSSNVILKRFLDNKQDFVARNNKRGPEPNLRKVDRQHLKA